MPKGCQALVLPLPWDAHCCASACEGEAGGGSWGYPGVVGAAHGLRCGSSETYPADTLLRSSGCFKTPKPPQITGFRPVGKLGGLPLPGRVSSASLGDRAKPLSRQAFSGRPGWMVLRRVPGASNGPASLQFGEAGLQRPNESSVCQSREQRQTGPRTPLRENEGRPRAKYDKKEHIKCSQVEVDSC